MAQSRRGSLQVCAPVLDGGLRLTFDLGVLAILLRLALDDGGWLGDDGRGGAEGPGRDLLQDVNRLDRGLRCAGAHRGGHGVGHRLDGLR